MPTTTGSWRWGQKRGSPTRDEESSACPCVRRCRSERRNAAGGYCSSLGLSVSACYIRKHLSNGLNYPVAVPITRLYYRLHHRPTESWPGYDCRNESRPHLTTLWIADDTSSRDTDTGLRKISTGRQQNSLTPLRKQCVTSSPPTAPSIHMHKASSQRRCRQVNHPCHSHCGGAFLM